MELHRDPTPDDRGRTVLRLRGEADVAGAPALAEALRGVQGDVLVDCAELTFGDVVVLEVLLSAARRQARTGCRLELRRPPRSLQLAIRVLQVGDQLPVVR